MVEETGGIKEIYEARQQDADPVFLCPFCREGTMVPSDEDRDIPTYVCPVCGAYYGEFLHTEKAFYYTPLQLQVGRAIMARTDMGDSQSISSLSVELSHEIGDCRAEEVAEAILYLEKEGILTSDGGIKMVEAGPERDDEGGN